MSSTQKINTYDPQDLQENNNSLFRGKVLQTEKIYHGFVVKRIRDIPEIHACAYEYEHTQSGAKLIYLETEDVNKVISICFRTPPKDSTGVFHILEHSVLNGSRKFHVKDPFAEMLKSSLASFINAFTSADWTMYPCASQNEADFHNLMDVYCDSVFFPHLTKETLLQEGWHYEIETDSNGKEKLIYNGVVYNEMQGVYGSPIRRIEYGANQVLFPDTIYAHESGGYPTSIPDLTYEQFIDAHRTYYHPSNSHIVLYGKMDIQEHLAFLHSEYLSKFDKNTHKPPVIIPIQKPLKTPQIREISYPVSSEESLKKQSYVTLHWCLGEEKTSNRHFDLTITLLNLILHGMESSPVKKALLQSGLGYDIFSEVEDGMQQGVYMIGLQGTDPEHTQEIENIIFKTLEASVKNGLDPALIRSACNKLEFQLRESDFGAYPKGIIYSIMMTKGFIYHENALEHLAFENILEDIKKQGEQGYFEAFIQKHLLENPHRVRMLVFPTHDPLSQDACIIQEKLEQVYKNLSSQEKQNIKQEAAILKNSQTTPNTLEQIKTLPKLHINEISQQGVWYEAEKQKEGNNCELLHTAAATSGICYITLAFDLEKFDFSLMPVFSCLAESFTRLGTTHYSPEKLDERIHEHTGGVSASLMSNIHQKTRGTKTYFCISGKFLHEKCNIFTKILQDLLQNICWENTDKIREVIQQELVNFKDYALYSGSRVVAMRLKSYTTKTGKIYDLIRGIGYYQFLKSLETTDYKTLSQSYQNCFTQMLKQPCTIHVTGEPKEIHNISTQIFEDIHICLGSLSSSSQEEHVPNNLQNLGLKSIPEPTSHEGITLATDVSYVGMGGILSEEKVKITGSFLAFLNMLRIDYFWQYVRLEGGAYGCHVLYDEEWKHLAIASYRDPQGIKTWETYRRLPEFLNTKNYSQEELETLVVGAFQHIDEPLTPKQQGARALNNYLFGKTHAEEQKKRKELLTTTIKEIKSYHTLFSHFFEKPDTCVFGGKQFIEPNAQQFKKIFSPFEGK